MTIEFEKDRIVKIARVLIYSGGDYIMTKEQMLVALDGLIAECARLRSKFNADMVTWTSEFIVWLKACVSTAELIFGTHSHALRILQSIYFQPPFNATYATGHQEQLDKLVWFDSGLRYAYDTLQGLRYSVERLAPTGPSSANPFIFISHGGPSRTHVDAMKALLEALGLSPIVVADLPNLNLSVNEKVTFYMGICTGAVVLATAEDEISTQEKRARPNVEHEIGSLQAAANIANRIVYMKEDSVTFASNYREKVWIPFEKECLEKAFVLIIQELKAFGFIT